MTKERWQRTETLTLQGHPALSVSLPVMAGFLAIGSLSSTAFPDKIFQFYPVAYKAEDSPFTVAGAAPAEPAFPFYLLFRPSKEKHHDRSKT